MQALVKRYEGQPFDILGVNTDSDKEKYKQDCITEGVTWRSTWEGEENAVVSTWGVNSFPTIYILDAEGVIRFKDSRGEGLERDVATLMAELVDEPIIRDEEEGDVEAPGELQADSGFQAVVAKHAAEEAAWNEAWRELRGKERRELKKLDPSRAYLADVQKYADAGNGRAKLWVATHLDAATDLKSSELKEIMPGLYTELCAGFASSDFGAEILDALIGEKRRLDNRLRAELLGQFAVNCKVHALEGKAMGEELAFYQEGLEPSDAAIAARLEEELFTNYLDTEAGASIWGAKNQGAFEGVGSMAPDFPAVDTDGEAFRLSDYRGQVVMLDFWGFW